MFIKIGNFEFDGSFTHSFFIRVPGIGQAFVEKGSVQCASGWFVDARISHVGSREITFDPAPWLLRVMKRNHTNDDGTVTQEG
ncbi:hypothetical protein MTBPR1_10075 [Candidatus Terasakiella magnetica]|uniref:Uncharacterized protein n=1 Tax=Candidatus Terasakiella magnetica TaxID=1867952 RepID=A0A1C3RC53_9PROT|nr:hypothetical protein [Candidatus Terasakiella magnetica]SCA54828.1 hypothetical protein MTBPR1_10075 [Candidatus Terasakiella magnetica]